MLPLENLDKNGAIWCNLGVPKYAITKLKISNFKVNKSTTTKVNCHTFPEVKSRCTCYTKINTFRINKGGLGAIPPEAEEILKNQTKWRLFLYFYFYFLAGLPRSPKL